MEDFEKNSDGKVVMNQNNLERIKKNLGPSLCLAKFTQVTLHLGTGQVHSCHHPKTHTIPLEELKQDPWTLFNTPKLKEARKEMLNGIKPSECEYCWRVERSGSISDRHYKSLDEWALPSFDTVVSSTGEEYVAPTYLEVSFSNACNFSCLYCGPEFSSKWLEDLKNNGPIKLMEGTDKEFWQQGWQDLDNLVIPNREENPYIAAFWEWFPQIYRNLKTYRITGGEPLMSKETFRSIDWFLENPNPDLEFSINTNFGVPDKLWDKFVEKITRLSVEKKVKKITIFTSVESWGEKAEYVRRGLDFELLQKRVEQVLKIGSIRCVIMSAFNMFAVTSFRDFLSWVLDLKRRYNQNGDYESFLNHISPNTGFGTAKGDKLFPFIMGIDIPYLRHPTFMDVQYCDHDMVEKYLLPSLKFMSDNMSNTHLSFEVSEVEKFKRIITHRVNFNMKDSNRDKDLDMVTNRARFYDYIKTLDARQGTNFLSVFPEMEPYLEFCHGYWQQLKG